MKAEIICSVSHLWWFIFSFLSVWNPWLSETPWHWLHDASLSQNNAPWEQLFSGWAVFCLAPLARHPTRAISLWQRDEHCFYLCGYNCSIYHMQDHRAPTPDTPLRTNISPEIERYRPNIYAHPLLIHSNEMLRDSFSG